MNQAVVHSLAMLYARTGEEKYLKLAEEVVADFAAPGAGDYLRMGLKEVEFFQIPKPRWESLHPMMGLVELYWLTGNEDYRKAFENLWWSIVKTDRHNNGGFSSGELPRNLRRTVPWGIACAALWGGCFVFSMAAASVWFAHKPLADLLVGLATFSLLVYLTERARGTSRGRLLPLLESRPLVALGHFSYSLYLTHLPVLAGCFFALQGLGWSGGVQALALLVVGSVASLVVAYAFHVAIERRFIVRR
jgi:hypothetical protein